MRVERAVQKSDVLEQLTLKTLDFLSAYPKFLALSSSR